MRRASTGRARRPRAPRRWSSAPFLIGVLLLAAILWLTYWYGASRIADAAFERATAAATARGYSVECADAAGGGFPLSVDLSCRTAGLADAAQRFTATLGELSASAPLYRPGRINGRAAGPLAIDAPGEGAAINADWADARASLDAGLAGLDAITLSATDLRLDLPMMPSPGAIAGLVAPSAELSINPGAEAGTYRLAGRFGQTVITGADGRQMPPIDLAIEATALDFAASLGLDPLQAMRDWIGKGGAFRLDRAEFTAGTMSLSASGDLAMSAQGTLSGTLDVEIAGSEALPDLAEAFQPGSRQRASEIAASLAAFTRPVETPAGTVRQTRLIIRDGVVSLGLFPIAVIPPLVF